MMDHSENTLRAAIKSLRDTVAPAVDPLDPQAVEQLRLTIDFLEFLRTACTTSMPGNATNWAARWTSHRPFSTTPR